VPFLAYLPDPVVEQLAKQLESFSVSSGDVIVREDGEGDRAYIIRHGSATVTHDGREIATLSDGDIFGEIALLHDTRRTATVTTNADTELVALDRDAFVAAVSGHAPTAEAVKSTIATRLTELETAFL
jgi:CRP-like cAMP-binding protein